MTGIVNDLPNRQQPVSGDNPSIWTDRPFFVDWGPDHFDGWKPGDPTGDDDTDRILGELYADIAVRYAQTVRKPDFITTVMAAIYFKTTRGLIQMGATEQGFLNRIARLAYVGSTN